MQLSRAMIGKRMLVQRIEVDSAQRDEDRRDHIGQLFQEEQFCCSIHWIPRSNTPTRLLVVELARLSGLHQQRALVAEGKIVVSGGFGRETGRLILMIQLMEAGYEVIGPAATMAVQSTRYVPFSRCYFVDVSLG